MIKNFINKIIKLFSRNKKAEDTTCNTDIIEEIFGKNNFVTSSAITAVEKETGFNCDSCKANVYEEEKLKCSKCGKSICTLCGTIDTVTKKVVCEDCW